MNQKIIESVIYVATRINKPNKIRVYSLLYLADIHHLSKYGRFVTYDTYIAGKDGPIPKKVDHYVEIANPDVLFQMCTDGLLLTSKSQLKEFSDSDIECLDHIIENYGDESDEMLKYLNCNPAWEATTFDSEIKLEDIVMMLPNKDELLDYLRQEGKI